MMMYSSMLASCMLNNDVVCCVPFYYFVMMMTTTNAENGREDAVNLYPYRVRNTFGPPVEECEEGMNE